MMVNCYPLQEVPSGMLGATQWYSKPEMQKQLQMEIACMKPHVGEVKWGVNCGTLPDGRMYWRVRQPVRAKRANGTYIYNSIYNLLLVYEPDHPKGMWGTSVHVYLEGPFDLTWLQSRVNRSPRVPKRINHTLADSKGKRYLCTSRYDRFGTDYGDARGVPTAKTALLCAIRWLHVFERA